MTESDLYRYADPVEACPECDSSQIVERRRKQPTWRCNDCAAEFESPTERPPRAAPNDRDTAIQALADAADAVDGALTQDKFDAWRESHPTAPSGDAIQHRHGWADICRAADVEHARVDDADLDDLVAAVVRVRYEIGEWPGPDQYREHGRGDEPSVPWFYENEPEGIDTWPDLIERAKGRGET